VNRYGPLSNWERWEAASDAGLLAARFVREGQPHHAAVMWKLMRDLMLGETLAQGQADGVA
jgi:hypothetical protein